MLLSASWESSANITNKELGSKAEEKPERSLKLVTYNSNKKEDRYRVVLTVDDKCFQLADSDNHEEAKEVFSLCNEIVPCFWSPKVPSHRPKIFTDKVLTKLMELMKEHGTTWSVAHMCVCLPISEETMMILLASDPLKGHFTSAHHPKQYRLLHLAIEQKSVSACRAIMRCSEQWLNYEDCGLYVEDADCMQPFQKAQALEAHECIAFLMQGQSGHDLHSQKTGGMFGYFTSDVLKLFENALLSKKYDVTKSLLENHPDLVRASFVDGNTALHKAKDFKTIVLLLERGADISTRNSLGDTALHAVIRAEYDRKNKSLAAQTQECVLALLCYGGYDPNCRTKGGMTPLHLATKACDLLTLKALIAFNADLSLVNDNGESVMDIAKMNQWKDGIDLLYMLGAVSYSMADSFPGHSNIRSYLPMIQRQPSATTDSFEDDEVGNSLSASLQSGFSSLPIGHFDWTKSCARLIPGSAISIAERLRNGDRVLCLDGGGIKGLILIEMLSNIEKMTGKRIIELFDWFVGTSTGGILALALVYTNKSLDELRTMYFKFKDSVFPKQTGMVPQGQTEVLEQLLKETFGENQTLGSKTYPRVLITATDMSHDPMRLEFFNNFEDGDLGKDQLVWVAARCTSAAPVFFQPYKQYLDGGLKANNPSLDAWTRIREYYMRTRQRRDYKIATIVSLGCGMCDSERKDMDALNFYHHWNNFSWWKLFVGSRKIAHSASELSNALLTEIVESDHSPVKNTRAVCEGKNVKYYCLSPHMEEKIELNEQSCERLIDMLINTKLYMLLTQSQTLNEIKKYTDL